MTSDLGEHWNGRTEMRTNHISDRYRADAGNGDNPHDDASSCGGFTLLEIMIAVMVFATVSVVLLQHLTISYSSSVTPG